MISITITSVTNYPIRGGEVKSAEGYVIHQNYTHLYDYGLVKLATDLEFNAKQSPVKLPDPGEDINSGHQLLIAGWGATEPGLPIPIHLRAVKLPVFDKNDCNELYAKVGKNLTSQEMCVGFADPEANYKTHIGIGDNGSPAVSTTY